MKSKITLGLLLIMGIISCKKYLDVKPDKKMVLPETLEDCQALLDNYQVMNTGFVAAEHFADNYYLTYDNWRTQIPVNRDGYIWKSDADTHLPNIWQVVYQHILYANQVLETLGKIDPSAAQQSDWNHIKGTALFHRAFSLYQGAGVWTAPYDAATAMTKPGMPIRLTPDLTEKTERGTVQRTYDRILQDLNEAATLLPSIQPSSVINKTRPSRVAAHALLARIYLAMRNYPAAWIQADQALKTYGTLIDYNTLNAGANFPLARYNPEVIFQAMSSATSTLSPFLGKVDPVLKASYAVNDLRNTIFFKANTGAGAGTYQFKGSYDGTQTANVFCGLATDELYLVRAECSARAGHTVAAMEDLNTLMRNRWAGTYITRTASDADDALRQILTERRKELLYRDLRWSDLRRLNKEPVFAKTLTRELNGTTYTLPPDDLRYTLLIPFEVLQRAAISQNER